MTYCLGIVTKHGLVMASDSRTNSGTDQVSVCRKMFWFEKPGERVFIVLTSGGLSLSQSVLTLLDADFQKGEGLAKVASMYEAARVIGDQVRKVRDVDQQALEKDDYKFNVHLLLGGQIGNEPPQLYMIYPQGNPLRATDDSPYLQIGEAKYGRPILDRGIKFDKTTLEEAAKYALISLDSTMRSNVTVGPPIDLIAYAPGELRVARHRRFEENDPHLMQTRRQWEQVLRRAVQELPLVTFGKEVAFETPGGRQTPPPNA
jgi:putative proteasome-type protease